ncbi:MAG: DUF3048 domain-containing protein [Acidimicrobiia bacterium]
MMLRRPVRVLVLLGALSLLLAAACGDDDGGADVEPSRLPLLGTEGDVPDRMALAVKIDNTERGRPPTGLRSADVVFEEVVEGGLTRLLAVYHSEEPDTVGPVRSARSTDLDILAELGRPAFAWAGANPTFAAAVEAADLIDVGVAAAPDAYERSDDRPAPYNLYASPSELWAAALEDEDAASGDGDGDGVTRPRPLFEYRAGGTALRGDDVEETGGFRTTGGEIATEIVWEWDEGDAAWVRSQDGSPHVDIESERITAANVIIRFTPYRDSGVRDSTGAVVPVADAIGEGEAWLLSDGKLQRGRWVRADGPERTEFLDAAGEPLRLTPGPTWVEVIPPGTGETIAPA